MSRSMDEGWRCLEPSAVLVLRSVAALLRLLGLRLLLLLLLLLLP